MQKEEFLKRTMNFGLRVIHLVGVAPEAPKSTPVLGHQLLRAGTSVGANYRAAVSSAKSRADFIAKMGIVEEECDEALYWMQTAYRIRDGEIALCVEDLMTEGNEILSIVVASIRTSRRNR